MSALTDSFRGEAVLITGHTGFKGGWLALWLARLGARVVGLSNGVPTAPSLFEAARIGEIAETITADIRDADTVRAAVLRVRPRFVFHLAAEAIVARAHAAPLAAFATNVMGTASVLDALRGVDWPCAAVLITSDKAYENVEWPWGYRETDALGGRDVYGGSKGAAELAIRAWTRSYFADPRGPVRLAVARAGNVIGGGDWAPGRIVPDCVRAWAAGGAVMLRHPDATRPWQHVLEALGGYLALGAHLAANPALHGEAFNFGPVGAAASVRRVVGALAACWGDDPAVTILPDATIAEARLLRLNSDKAAHALGWSAALTTDAAIAMTGAWYRAVLRDAADARACCFADIAEYEGQAAALGPLA